MSGGVATCCYCAIFILYFPGVRRRRDLLLLRDLYPPNLVQLSDEKRRSASDLAFVLEFSHPGVRRDYGHRAHVAAPLDSDADMRDGHGRVFVGAETAIS